MNELDLENVGTADWLLANISSLCRYSDTIVTRMRERDRLLYANIFASLETFFAQVSQLSKINAAKKNFWKESYHLDQTIEEGRHHHHDWYTNTNKFECDYENRRFIPTSISF